MSPDTIGGSSPDSARDAAPDRRALLAELARLAEDMVLRAERANLSVDDPVLIALAMLRSTIAHEAGACEGSGINP